MLQVHVDTRYLTLLRLAETNASSSIEAELPYPAQISSIKKKFSDADGYDSMQFISHFTQVSSSTKRSKAQKVR